MPEGPGILDRKLLFVTGKGGVGKSTVASALAHAMAKRTGRVLLAHFAQRPQGPAARADGVWELDVAGDASMDEYLSTAIPAPLYRRVLRSRLYRAFVGAAPGLGELMALGKLAYEIRWGEPNAPWPAVVVDAPSTGHALEILSMPGAAHDSFGALVRSEAARLDAALRDPARTAILIVTTPEELPVQEALEAAEALGWRDLPLGPLFVNAVRTAPVAASALPATGPSAPVLLREALGCAREEAGWAALHTEHLHRLHTATGLERIELPFLFAEEIGAEQIDALATTIERQLAQQEEVPP